MILVSENSHLECGTISRAHLKMSLKLAFDSLSSSHGEILFPLCTSFFIPGTENQFGFSYSIAFYNLLLEGICAVLRKIACEIKKGNDLLLQEFCQLLFDF